METPQLVYLGWLSQEREKHIWEDLYYRSWDEIIGRMYLLKAHSEVENDSYATALADFEQAVVLLAKDDVRQEYYARALSDKAVAQCFMRQYEAALTTINQALAVADQSNQDTILDNRGAILVLTGAFSEALNILSTQLDQHIKDSYIRFTLATCLLHLERYPEAIVAYEKAIAEDSSLQKEGLVAARLGRQPDWDKL